MTVREILSAMRRRWYVSLALFACAAVVTVLLAWDGGVYTTRTVVSFMRPAATSLSPTNGTTDQSVIAFAGAVVQEVNDGRSPARYSLDEAPYYGAGLREGVLLTLASAGSQWVSTFSKSEAEIQIVGRSVNWVKARQAQLVDEVVRVSNAQQAALDISSDARITATVVPLTTQIEYVSPSLGSRVAAGAAMLAVALILGAWGSITADRLLVRRQVHTSTEAEGSPRRILEGTHS